MKEKEMLSERAVSALLSWYRECRRDLPWRRTKDPYCIWISEIMLQQTRVEAVKPYYARFMRELPTVEALAAVSEERLLKLWEGLGYYSRARNLQRAAKTVVLERGGVLPRTYEEWRTLPGVGDYTAGAIASISFDQRVPAIDGNVLRVLARVTGSYEDIAQPQTKQAWRTALMPTVPAAAGDFNQALIELGATVCVPNGEALCGACPLSFCCVAAREHLTDELPVRAAKKPRKIEPITVFLISDEGRIALHRRPPSGLLAGLFEFPNAKGHLDEGDATAWLRSIGFEPLRLERIDDAKHIFTHIEWHMIGYRVRISPDFDGVDEGRGYFLIDHDDLQCNYALPSAFGAYNRYLQNKRT